MNKNTSAATDSRTVASELEVIRSNETRDKRYLYRTAKALIGCAYFKAGEIVGVQYYGRGAEGKHYFLCAGQEVCYPEHHLSEFCL